MSTSAKPGATKLDIVVIPYCYHAYGCLNITIYSYLWKNLIRVDASLKISL